jgi:predicted kinase
LAVILRGPLGVGKTTISGRLARALPAEVVSIDRILDDRDLWRSGRVSEFLRANRFAGERGRELLTTGRSVVFDGNFYWKTQIADLVGRLPGPTHVFTLEAPLRVCRERDRRRAHPHGEDAARQVYAKSTRFSWGIEVDATGTPAAVVSTILRLLPPRKGGPLGSPGFGGLSRSPLRSAAVRSEPAHRGII